MKWVNGDGEQYIKKPLLKYSIYVESDGKESSQIQVEDSFKYSSRTLSLNEHDNADIFEEISNQIQHESEEVIESLRETYSVDSLINGKINQGDHLEEPTIIKWRSRAGHYYDQKVFPCCGKLCIYNSTCGRKSWKSKDAYHSGKLVGSGSNRCGGGQSPIGSSIDHIPKAKATWSCCHKSAESEGCVSSGYTLLFKSGNKKIVSKKLTEEECELY